MTTRVLHPPRRAADCSAGFTLVELLAVLGIMGLLAALLLPAMAGAKRKAAVAQCIGNLKQLSTATALYSGDFGQAYPLAIYKPVPDEKPVFGFDDWIYGYAGTTLTLAEQEARAIPLAKRLRSFTCPADKVAPLRDGPDIWRRTYSMAEANMSSSVTGPPLRNIQNGSVGVYYSTFWGPFPSENPNDHARLTEAVLLAPSDTLLLVERPHQGNWGGNDHYAVTRSTADQSASFPRARQAADYHGGGRFVYAHCDGRVTALKREHTWGRRGSDSAWAGDWTIRTDD